MSDPVTLNVILIGVLLICVLLMAAIIRLFPLRQRLKSRFHQLLATWMAFSLGAKASLAFILAAYVLVAEITG